MNALIQNPTTENQVTMTSLEIVDFINTHRKESGDDTVLRHADFMAKVPNVLGLEMNEKFRSSYLDSYGREKPCYKFPKREACLMAMSYSYELQAMVFDRMTAMEEALKTIAPKAKRQSFNLGTVSRQCVAMAKAMGLKGNQAILSADRAVKKLTGESPLELLEITHLSAPVQEQVFTPTQIGNMLTPPLSPRAVNRLLIDKGLQVKVAGQYCVTKKGEKLGELFDVGKRHSDGTAVKQIKWYQSVISLL